MRLCNLFVRFSASVACAAVCLLCRFESVPRIPGIEYKLSREMKMMYKAMSCGTQAAHLPRTLCIAKWKANRVSLFSTVFFFLLQCDPFWVSQSTLDAKANELFVPFFSLFRFLFVTVCHRAVCFQVRIAMTRVKINLFICSYDLHAKWIFGFGYGIQLRGVLPTGRRTFIPRFILNLFRRNRFVHNWMRPIAISRI